MKTKEFIKKVYDKEIYHFYILDTETTGLSTYDDAVIQLSILEIDHGNIVNSFDSYYDTDVYISPFISRLTGITHELVAGKIKVSEDDSIRKFFKNDAIIIAHNMSFDRAMLSNNDVNLLDFTWIDSIYVFKALFPNRINYKLDGIIDEFGKGSPHYNRRHNSLSDVHNLAHVLSYAFSQIKDIDAVMEIPLAIGNSKTDNYNAEYHVDKEHIRNSMNGRVVCFTGSLRVKRSAMIKLIEESGAIHANGVTSKVDLLVVGHAPGSKLQIAKDRGIEIINEDEFENLIN